MRHSTFFLPEAYFEALDKLVKLGHFSSRSEAIRTAVRDLVKEENFLYDLKLFEQIPKLRALIEVKEED